MPLSLVRRSAYSRLTAAQRGYDARWRRARLTFLRANPYCQMCRQVGRVTRATVVDHITPHKGDLALFWDAANWQALCATCHSAGKQAQETTGKVRGCDENGIPLDPNHRWRA